MKGVEQMLIVEGGARISGCCRVHRAKNAVLPILAASLLCDSKVMLPDLPDLSDLAVTKQLLSELKMGVTEQCRDLILSPDDLAYSRLDEKLTAKLRASTLFLGPMLARFGKVTFGGSGGCAIGKRPIDLHLYGLAKLGAQIKQEGNAITLSAEMGLKGADIRLRYPSVGATENILMAASLAKGRTTLSGGAAEPEVLDLVRFLNRCGAKIETDGAGNYQILGQKRLHGCCFFVMPDRIEAATYLAAAAATGGEILLTFDGELALPLIGELFEIMGCRVLSAKGGLALVQRGRLSAPRRLTTLPYPGFPTDLQAVFTTLCALAKGQTVIRETVFEERFSHLSQLQKMGAEITVCGREAVIFGVKELFGTEITIPDLRAGGGLLVAALAARGESRLSALSYVDRGYDQLYEQLSLCGARIKKMRCEDGKGTSRPDDPCRV